MPMTKQQRDWFFLQQQRKRRRGGLAPAVVQRHFTDLTAAGGQYYSLSDTITLTGDFEIEVDFETTSAADNIIIGDSSNKARLFIFGGNLLLWSDTGAQILSAPAASYIDGVLHTVKVTRVGSALEMFVDGASVDVAASVNQFTFGQIGAWNSGNFWNGIIANVKITDGSTLVGDFPLDEDWVSDNVAHNRANPANNATAENITSADVELFTQDGSDWLGAELIASLSSNSGEVVDNGDGTFTATSTTAARDVILQGVSSVQNYTYRFEYTVNSITTGGFVARAGAVNGDVVSSPEIKVDDVVSGSTVVGGLRFRVLGNTSGTFTPQSTKRLLQTA